MKDKLKYLLCFAIFVSLLFVAAHASTSDSVANLYYLDLYSDIYPNFNSPYNIAEGEGDIDETSGAMRTNVEDYRFKGKNGFDVSVVRSYNTSSTEGNIIYDDFDTVHTTETKFYNYYICSEDGAKIKILFDNEEELLAGDPSFIGDMYSDNQSRNTYSILQEDDGDVTYTLYNPAQEPYVETEDTSKRKYLTYEDTEHAFINLGDGSRISKVSLKPYYWGGNNVFDDMYLLFQDFQAQTHVVLICYDTATNPDSVLETLSIDGVSYSKYKPVFVDMSNANARATHPRGFTYNFVLEADTGEKYYVYRSNNSTYKVLYGEDRYGNGYTINSDGGYSIVTDDNITYNISTSGISKTQGEVTTELVDYHVSTVNGTNDPYEKYDFDNEFILTVTKNSGTTEQIQPDEEDVTKYYVKRALKYDKVVDDAMLVAYKLPYKIEFPSGLTKHFEYTSMPWVVSTYDSWMTVNGFHCPVSRYYETDADGNIKNESEFTYTTERGTDKVYRITEVSRKYLSDTANKTLTTYINTNGQISSQTVERKTVSNAESVTHEYTYNSNSSDARITEDRAEYFVKNVLKGTHTKEYAYRQNHYLREEIDGDYEAIYTYHEDDNYIPATITYDKDEDTTVFTENLLTDDGKSIATTNVYENDNLIKSTSYTYDTYGNVASETVMADDETSYVTAYSYTYAPNGGFTLVTTKSNIKDADGNVLPDIVTTSVYDADHNLLSHTDANGNTTVMTYDKLGRLLGTTYPDGTSDSYTYDISDCITTYTAPNGTVYKAYFDAWQNPIRKTVVLDDEEITLEVYEYDDRCNVAVYTKYFDEDDFVQAEYTYDYLNRPVTENVYSNNDLTKTTTYTYTITKVDGKPVHTTTAAVSGDNGTYASVSQSTNYRGFTVEDKVFTDTDSRTNTYTHDYVGNVLTATDAMGNVTTTVYNGLNAPISVTYPDGTSVGTAYNMAGLAVSVTDARGNTSNNYYDNAGRLIKATAPIDSQTTAESKTYYDANGNVTSQKTLSSMAGETAQYVLTDTSYDSMNRPVAVTTHPDEDTQSVTKYTYDVMGNVTSVTNGLPSVASPISQGHTTSYEYDELGRMTEETAPDGKTETNVYDLAGRVITATDKANTQSTYTYDVFNNILTMDKGDESISYTYDLMGNRTSMTDSTGTTEYTYSPYGELTNEEKDSILKVYTYDALGRRIAMSIQDGEDTLTSQSYTYDNMGRLISTLNGTDTAEYTYDENSNVLTETVNGTLLKSSTYNMANLPETILTHLPDGTETTQRIYTADGNLRMETKGDRESLYYYDGANRLISESTFSDDASYEDFYTYDRFGNRVNKEHTDLDTYETQSIDYTYNNLNQLVQQTDGTDSTTYDYDDNGNMLTVATNDQTVKTYTYDVFNRLATANVNGNNAQYTYNGDNLRQTKTVNGVAIQHVYDGQNIVADISDNTNTYIYGLALVGIRTNDGTMQIYATTPRGDVDKLINADGTYAEYEYDAYGNPTSDNIHTINPFGYTGQYTDYETGLVYLRNRYYDTELGMFITEDPIKDGLNWYAYCGGNPVAFVDPSGKNFLKDIWNSLLDTVDNVQKTTKKAIDNSQKTAQRTIWKIGAQEYLREQKGYLTSAWLLEHACQDNPSDQYRYNDSRIANLIKSDDAFKEDLAKVMSEKENEGAFTTEVRTLKFSQGDLYYSIHRCEIIYSGTKQSDGTWTIDCYVEDTYDYTEITSMMGEGFSMGTTLGTVANDAAVISQATGALSEFDIFVCFEVRWPQ